MEISPIPGLRVLPAVKRRPSGPELTARFDIEAPVQPGDSVPVPSLKASGAEEDESEDDDLLPDSGEETPAAAPSPRISFFA